jgi:FkbM family methyltransferase
MIQETEMERARASSFWQKEPETIAWIQSFNPRGVFYDVGANVGVYALYAAKLSLGMQVYAFEPAEKNFSSLLGNRIQTKLWTLIPMRFAIGSFTGRCFLSKPYGEAGTSGAQMIEYATGNVSAITIDEFAKCFPHPDYVKIDIDGKELSVLEGMRQTLPVIKSVLIEVSSSTKLQAMHIMAHAGFSHNNQFNTMTPHSRERRKAENIDAENIVFVRQHAL